MRFDAVWSSFFLLPTAVKTTVGLSKKRSSPASINFLPYKNIYSYLVQFHFWAKAKSVYCIGTHVWPLSKFLWSFSECHIRSNCRINDSLSSFNGDNSVEGSWGIVKEWNIDSRWGGRKPWPLGFGVDVEHVSLTRENRLFPEKYKKKELLTFRKITNLTMKNKIIK